MDTDKIIKYNYVVGVYQYLLQALQQTRMELKKSPQHVTHLANANKIKDDIRLIEPVVNDLQNDLNQDLENLIKETVDRDAAFKFIRKPEGKEVSLNAKDHAETKKR